MSNQAAATAASHEDDSLINWKTHAWQDAGMVSWYSGRMVENTSTNYLKNVLEVGTVKRHIRGKEVLDIGIGTGRASLPLIEQGFAVTGIDSSQAMLNETRRLAGNLPITLKLGDITKLPFDAESFDSAIALNVMVHFPTGGRLCWSGSEWSGLAAASCSTFTPEITLKRRMARISISGRR